MTDVNYEAWAMEMSGLLDRIEAVREDEETVGQLCASRFAIAAKHGIQVIRLGETSGATH